MLKRFFAFTATKVFVRAQTPIERARILLVQMDDNQSDLYINFLRMFKFCAENQDLLRITPKALNAPVETRTELHCAEPVAFYLGEDQA